MKFEKMVRGRLYKFSKLGVELVGRLEVKPERQVGSAKFVCLNGAVYYAPPRDVIGEVAEKIELGEPARTTPAVAKAIHNADQANAAADDARAKSPDGMLPSESAMARSAKFKRPAKARAIAATAGEALGRSAEEHGTERLAAAIAEPPVVDSLAKIAREHDGTPVEKALAVLDETVIRVRACGNEELTIEVEKIARRAREYVDALRARQAASAVPPVAPKPSKALILELASAINATTASDDATVARLLEAASAIVVREATGFDDALAAIRKIAFDPFGPSEASYAQAHDRITAFARERYEALSAL